MTRAEEECSKLKDVFASINEESSGFSNRQIQTLKYLFLESITKQPGTGTLDLFKQESYVQEYWDKIKSEIPDWKDITESADFLAWHEKQPEDILKMLSSANPYDVVSAIRKYKVSAKPTLSVVAAKHH